ncbi:hypothetical protein F4804DRAFT_308354 [Jackrogersella minutella]|nr:hypothetical protein F4804DRAFT_308354 [Jackrogersella minutella]
MAQIDPVNLLFYSAALLCVSNAIACHCVAWHVYNINRRYKVGAIVGIYMAFASIFGAAVACIYYGFYPALGHCLVVVATVIGSLRIWNMVLEVSYYLPSSFVSYVIFICVVTRTA